VRWHRRRERERRELNRWSSNNQLRRPGINWRRRHNAKEWWARIRVVRWLKWRLALPPHENTRLLNPRTRPETLTLSCLWQFCGLFLCRELDALWVDPLWALLHYYICGRLGANNCKYCKARGNCFLLRMTSEKLSRWKTFYLQVFHLFCVRIN